MGELRFVRQRKSNDCGVASLKMIIDYYLGGNVSYDELRRLSRKSFKGSSVLNLCNAAYLMGFRALPIRTAFSHLVDLPLPFIAFVNGNHYVVVSEIYIDKVVTLDPAIGKIEYNYEVFAEVWCGRQKERGIAIVIQEEKKIERIEKSIDSCHNGKQAIVFVTHHYPKYVKDRFERLDKDLSLTDSRVFLLYDSIGIIDGFDSTENICVCETAKMKELNYKSISDSIVPGSTHFLHLFFYLQHREYEKYWFIEYDVDFAGKWSHLFEDCRRNLSEYDFLSCHIERFDRCKNGKWEWWYDNNKVGVPYKECVKSFNPICRYSNRALDCLDQYLKQGHSAHSEVMIATCLYHHGMKIGDIGGHGEFVPKGWEDKYYLASEGIHNGTMRYRPVYTKEEIEEMQLKDKLFHPLKDFSL